jgi:hypothetical protein
VLRNCGDPLFLLDGLAGIPRCPGAEIPLGRNIYAVAQMHVAAERYTTAAWFPGCFASAPPPFRLLSRVVKIFNLHRAGRPARSIGPCSVPVCD